MASISLPPQSQSGFPPYFDPSAPSDIASSHRMSMPPPLPNPPFVFPARDPDLADSQSETPDGRAPPPLPAFSFHPGSSQSSQPAPAHNPRAGGHRRRPSEFVGGDQLVTPPAGDGDKRDEPLSPTKPSAPSGPPPGRGPGRRHHAHRRSAAVSGVDLNAINKALGTNLTAGSAPCTPGDRNFDTGHEDISRPLSYSAGSLGRPTPPASPQFVPVPPVPPVPPIPAAIYIQPAPNNDDEDIGRPVSAVSAVSSETLTNNTVKVEQPGNPPPVQSRPTQNRSSKPRPKTADASLAFDLIPTQNVPDVPAVKRSKSTGHSRSRKSMSTGNLEAMLASNGPDDAHSTDTSRPSYSDDGSESSYSEHDGDGTSPKKSRSKSKKKRVRSWAGAILTRGKGKRHAKPETEEKKRPTALTPPTLTRTNSEVGSVLDVDFDNDDVVVLRTPTNPEATFAAAESVREEPPTPVPAPAPAPSLETAWKPRSFYEQTAQGDMLSSPIIDLDAALGPFNTPDMRPAHGAPSKFSVATQRMYSGGRRGEFVGPEMRYHRRTESAPVMQPFDRSSLGPIRLGGTTSETPDVFYEEEEDEFLAASQSPRGRATPIPSGRVMPAQRATSAKVIAAAPAVSEDDKLSIKSGDSADTSGTAKTARTAKTAGTLTRAPEASSSVGSLEQTGLGIQATDKVVSQLEAHPVRRHVPDPMHDTGNPFAGQPQSPIDILKSEDRITRPRVPPSPDVSPGFLAVDKRPATSPHELLPNIPRFSLSAGVSPTSSSFPSPDAPRAFNDRNFSSHSYQHLPSDYTYASVEDVPSLTSSASTMTNTMNRLSSSFFPRARLSTDRAASFSAAVHRRSSQANSSKRSSLASLSKLVGGPHSERSKLHQEEKPPGDAPDSSKMKGRRLSRLMHFWKLRETEKSGAETAAPSERPM